MAVSSTATEISYAGNGSTITPYVIPFAFLQTDHIAAEVDGTALGAGTFTVQRDSDGGGGFLRTEAAVAATSDVRIARETPLTQPAVFQLAGPLPSKTIETSLDRLELQIQELAADLAAALARIAVLEAADGDGGAGNLITEGGDILITEDGDILVTEDAPSASSVSGGVTTEGGDILTDEAGNPIVPE